MTFYEYGWLGDLFSVFLFHVRTTWVWCVFKWLIVSLQLQSQGSSLTADVDNLSISRYVIYLFTTLPH
jgi:hypothetical protein